MGGVDLSDMLCSLYKTPLRTRKYFAIFGWLLDISLLNAWCLYKKDHSSEAMRLKGFRVTVADELLLYRRPKRGRPTSSRSPSSPPEQSKVVKVKECTMKDGIGHLPIFRDRGKCRFCHKGFSNVFCERCNLRFCLTKKAELL
ncbi:hypothetical protein JTE90_027217 [Oedothorax gibbosus]|uniref:PiggyBac transposable element-derived protein domain-containing protein n=1 Tax=Oedothorax gibbosus TaxID=931172 RepID=A0AAV6U1M2_9ARAC|nr:hypothetical protein JTE90_027217 [Oedothorax gibbosus]